MTVDNRLSKIFENSCTLFINSGYPETKMKDIAKFSGISVGAMYDLFESKKALLDFIFISTLDKDNLTKSHEFPLKEISSSFLVKKNKTTYELYTKTLHSNLLNANSNYSLEQLITDLFDIFKIYGRYFLILEKNPTIDTNLIKLYAKYRMNLYKNISIYLQNNPSIQKVDNPEYDSMMIVDLVFWWATHKKYDSFENTKNKYSIDIMTKTIINALTNGLKK
ncbi:TetR/AcrR family transcriptional regulator [Companilactobacillus keshanensis]|uniref:TetR/AcrR family transcriptional regulator n=1 Tax=Companilactobacillus keshanensis TaxID=2486003 RepID=A0ABW4BSX0_9LACO|nr:TetR/AcrR family transcriptional regulator [Companilactobacillus keshanensis]